jgi:hypothetical protein
LKVTIPNSHACVFAGETVIAGKAFTVITMLIGVPGQELADGVTM